MGYRSKLVSTTLKLDAAKQRNTEIALDLEDRECAVQAVVF